MCLVALPGLLDVFQLMTPVIPSYSIIDILAPNKNISWTFICFKFAL